MKNIAFAALIAGLLLPAIGSADTPMPVMKVLIAPGPMDESVNQAEVKVTVTLERVHAPAGTALFALPAFPDLIVTDSKGRVKGRRLVKGKDNATGDAEFDDSRHWKAARAVNGQLVIRYRVPVENTLTNGGIPPLGPRIDGKGFSAAGQTFLAIPRSTTAHRIVVSWDLSAMGPGATASSSFGDGNVELAPGPPSRLERAVFMAGQLNRDPAIVTPNGFSAVWSGDPGFDLRPLMQWASRLHTWMATFFPTGGDPPYRVFLRY